MLRNIIRFTLWKGFLAAGSVWYWIKAYETAVERDELLTAICLAPFCLLLFLTGFSGIVMYFIRLVRLDAANISKSIKNYNKCFAECHYFGDDHLLTMEIPAKIYFKVIDEICSYSYGHVFYLTIYTLDGRKYTLKQFRKRWNILKIGKEGFDTHRQMTDLILMMNGNIRIRKK